MSGLGEVTLVVDGIDFGCDIDRAFVAIAVDAGVALFEKLETGQHESGTRPSVSDRMPRKGAVGTSK